MCASDGETQGSPYRLRRGREAAERAAILRRASTLRAEVERRGIVKAWLAGAIGRSGTLLLRALHGQVANPHVLDRVEAVLAAVDAGAVAPAVHGGPIPALVGDAKAGGAR